MDRWDFKDYVPTKKEKKIDREEFLSQFIQCPECGYRNKKVFFRKKWAMQLLWESFRPASTYEIYYK